MTKMPLGRSIAPGAVLVAALVTVLTGGWLWTTAGVSVLQALGGWLTAPMQAITFLGDERFYLVFIPLVFWCLNKETGADLGILLTASGVLNGVLKSYFKHHRPFWENASLGLVEAESFSLPSGHAQNSTALLGFLAGVRLNGQPWLRAAWPVLMIVLTVLVCLSRVYLGVHFPGDVIWGAAVGLLLLSAYKWIKPRAKPFLAAQPLGLHVVLAVMAALAVIALNALDLAAQYGTGSSFPAIYTEALRSTMDDAATMAGMVFGLWAGLAFESRFVRFSVDGPLWQRVVRYLVGVVVLVAIWMGLKMVFPVEPAPLGLGLRTLRYALSVLWVLVGWPWLFVRIGLGRGEGNAISPARPAL